MRAGCQPRIRTLNECLATRWLISDCCGPKIITSIFGLSFANSVATCKKNSKPLRFHSLPINPTTPPVGSTSRALRFGNLGTPGVIALVNRELRAGYYRISEREISSELGTTLLTECARSSLHSRDKCASTRILSLIEKGFSRICANGGP